MTTGRTLCCSRLERLMADEMAAFEQANPRSRELSTGPRGASSTACP